MSSSAIQDQAKALESLSVRYIQEMNWQALEDMLDPACQFVGAKGSYDRQSAMTLMKEMNLGEVDFKDFKVTQAGDNLIISFWICASEYQDGKKMSSTYSPRLSVWKQSGNTWKCIAYADLIAPES